MTSGGVWSEEDRDGLRLMRGRLGGMEVGLLPELGGKMVSLRSARGREWLWQPTHRPYRKPVYGGAFEAYDISGFDECFPGIGEGPYPLAPWKGVTVPDHGEVWTLPWDASIRNETLALSVHGVRFPYRLENLCPFPLRYVWSAHPLLAAEPGMRVVLPHGVGVQVDWSKGGRLGALGAEHGWPRTRDAAGSEVVLDTLSGTGAGTADKLYTRRLDAGLGETICALHDLAAGEYVGFRFDPAQVPYVGVWLNMGGWPLEGAPCFNVALEPCSGYPDRLDLAVARNEASTIDGGETKRWQLRLEMGRGTPGVGAGVVRNSG